MKFNFKGSKKYKSRLQKVRLIKIGSFSEVKRWLWLLRPRKILKNATIELKATEYHLGVTGESMQRNHSDKSY